MSGNAYQDLTGQKFGRLTVASMERCRHTNVVMWRCRCECGATSKVASTSLKRGKTRSCGCLSAQTRRVANQLRKSIGYDL